MNMTTKGDADFFIFSELDLRTLRPTFYVLTNAQARATFRDYIGGGNCYPPEVRLLITPNDFSALTAHHDDARGLASAPKLSDRRHVNPR
ncbi:hypothetical protein [Rhizobium ruizarguesonis]|uniref:hypothetical protein n=1 Tax=Rhizobium ruizarguesonis TaxID=2081791 RepID=UPI00102FCFFF|nr:hypothetical protein [Rhizobium ruizarguesonis]TBA18774.1 hypothetical protein ELH65_23955 [Rhizobium ruizarguesonis]